MNRPHGALICVVLMLALATHAASLLAAAAISEPPPQKAAVPLQAAPARPAPAIAQKSLLERLSEALMGREGPQVQVRVAQPAEDPNVRNLMTQFQPQFEQLLYVELALLRRVGQVEPKPFADIAKAAKAKLSVAVREYAVAQNAQMRRRWGAESTAVDPHSHIQRLLVSLAEAKLSREQAMRYRQECDKRTEHRRRAVVLNLVAVLDERLVLNEQQREKLVQSLTSKYQDAWEQWMQVMRFNHQYLPSLDDDLVVSVLDDKQQAVWRQSTKQGVSFWGIGFAEDGIGRQAPEIQEIARMVEDVQDEQ